MTHNDLKPRKYINDPVYGAIPLTKLEVELIDTPLFQRLRGLKQLAHANYIFPGAEHSRFVHSLGVLFIMAEMTNHLLRMEQINAEDVKKLRVAALLHDIGHYPLSHLGENVYGYCFDKTAVTRGILKPRESSEKLYAMASSRSKSADHERLGQYIVESNEIIKDILTKYQLDPHEIGTIFTGDCGAPNQVFSQLIHSSLDADRLDYLLRDSYQTGVKYGLVDLQYLIRLLTVHEQPTDGGTDKILSCNKKGQHVVEHFLMSRYFHYSQVIFHKTNVAFECLIKAMYIKLVQAKKFIYNSFDDIKANINDDKFLNFNDANLYVAFKNYYEENENRDDDFKILYNMYIKRVRPKVIFDIKALYDESPHQKFSVLKWILKSDPEKITAIVGSEKWGYNISPIKVERIQGKYPLTKSKDHEEDLREAVRLYDSTNSFDPVPYLAEDQLSVISRLSTYTNEFIRIFVLEEKEEEEYTIMTKKLNDLIITQA